jgi:AcrR family transcriptional regulator
VTQTSAPVRRPRDRRQQIIASAAGQFRASGYHNVGITEIAEAVGITSAALYRHFGGKQDLLLATVQDALERLGGIAAPERAAGLDDLLAATCALTLSRPEVGILWARELTHLPAENQRELRTRLIEVTEPLRSALRTTRPDLTDDGVDLLLWAAVGVVSGTGYRSVRLEPARLQGRLLEACRAVCRVAPVASADPDEVARARQEHPARLLPASRQEAILTAATRLFSARGYQEVGLDDIGAAAGITGATVYHHFANKSAILEAGLSRCLQAMFFDLSAALESSATPSEALDMALRRLVRTCVDQGHVIATLQNEIINLPGDRRRVLLEMEADYVGEWVALLTQHRSDLSEAEANVLVRATISSISSLLAIPHIRWRATFPEELVAIGRAILGLGAGPSGTSR